MKRTYPIAIALVIVILFIACNSAKRVSNQQHTESHETSQKSSETTNKSTTTKDAVIYRDSVRYVERIVNDTVYRELEVKVYVDREKAVHDTVYIEKSDTTKVKDETNDKDSEQETIVEQPSVWQRMKEGLAWGFILLVVLGLTYTVCKMIIRRRI